MTSDVDDLRPVEPPRDLGARELALLAQLMQQPFAGRDAIRSQLASARVDGEGTGATRTIRFVLTRDDIPRARTSLRVPVEGEVMDEDGVPIGVLLHVVGGIVKELEIYRVDGKSIRRRDLGEMHSVSVNEE